MDQKEFLKIKIIYIIYVLTIQSVTLKKSFESISLEYRRRGDINVPENGRESNLPPNLFSGVTRAISQI